MNHKSIVFLVSNDLATDRRMSRICKTLSDTGYNVTIIGRFKSDSPPLINKTYKQKRIRCRFSRGWLFYAELNIRLCIFLLTRKFDIIVAVDSDTLLSGAFGKKGTCKMVFDAHEWFEEVPELISRPSVKKVWKYIASIAIPRSDLRYTVSESLATNLQNLYSFPFEVIHNYPVLGEQEFPGGVRENIVVYVGVLNRGRGLEQAILAMKQIDAEFWIIGEGDLSMFLRQLVVKSQLVKKVFFMGWKTPRAIRNILSQARIGLNLLDPKSRSYYHSLANKFFDYVHAGVPALNMQFPEYIRYNGIHEVSILHEDLDEQQIAHSIQSLLDDNKMWNRLHRNCQIAAQSWCWEKERSRLITLFERL